MHALEVIIRRNAAAAGREAAEAVNAAEIEKANRIAHAADPRIHSSFLVAYWQERGWPVERPRDIELFGLANARGPVVDVIRRCACGIAGSHDKSVALGCDDVPVAAFYQDEGGEG